MCLHLCVYVQLCTRYASTRPANLTGTGISIWWAPGQLMPVFLFAYSSFRRLTFGASVRLGVAFPIGASYKIIYSLAFMDPRYLWLLWHCSTYTKFYLAASQGFWVSVIAVTAKTCLIWWEKMHGTQPHFHREFGLKTRALTKIVN